MKFLFWFIGTLVSIFIAIIPEMAMYFTYQLISPESEGARIVTLIAFWAIGSGMCVFFAFLGFFIFTAITAAVLDAK